jgi:hypothetical protein
MASLYKSRMNISANQGDWRLPSSPVVEQKHKDFLCKWVSGREADDVDDDADVDDEDVDDDDDDDDVG